MQGEKRQRLGTVSALLTVGFQRRPCLTLAATETHLWSCLTRPMGDR